MARYRVTIASPRSAEEVFDYMAMFSNVTEWDPTAAEAHPIDGNQPGGHQAVTSSSPAQAMWLTPEQVTTSSWCAAKARSRRSFAVAQTAI